jgi:hypothetical protein
MNINTMRATILIILLAFMVTPVAASVYYTSSAPQIITKGDTFTISGTGAKNGMVTIWIIGRNYFDTFTATPDRFGNFSATLKPTTTEKFSSGQYAVILQDPGASRTLEIEPGTDSSGNLTIMNRGKIIERIGARQDLKGNVQPVVAGLMDAANIQNVDDTFLPEYFFVEEPSVQFDNLISVSSIQLSDQVTGERIAITGTTNMGPENSLRAQVYNRNTNALITSNTLPVVAGNHINRWTYELKDPGLPQGEYYLTIGWTKSNQTGTGLAKFTVKDSTNTTPPPLPFSGIEKDIPRDDVSTLLFLTISGVLILILIVFAVGKK